MHSCSRPCAVQRRDHSSEPSAEDGDGRALGIAVGRDRPFVVDSAFRPNAVSGLIHHGGSGDAANHPVPDRGVSPSIRAGRSSALDSCSGHVWTSCKRVHTPRAPEFAICLPWKGASARSSQFCEDGADRERTQMSVPASRARQSCRERRWRRPSAGTTGTLGMSRSRRRCRCSVALTIDVRVFTRVIGALEV